MYINLCYICSMFNRKYSITSSTEWTISVKQRLAELAALERAGNGEPQLLRFVFLFQLHLIRLET